MSRADRDAPLGRALVERAHAEVSTAGRLLACGAGGGAVAALAATGVLVLPEDTATAIGFGAIAVMVGIALGVAAQLANLPLFIAATRPGTGAVAWWGVTLPPVAAFAAPLLLLGSPIGTRTYVAAAAAAAVVVMTVRLLTGWCAAPLRAAGSGPVP